MSFGLYSMIYSMFYSDMPFMRVSAPYVKPVRDESVSAMMIQKAEEKRLRRQLKRCGKNDTPAGTCYSNTARKSASAENDFQKVTGGRVGV